MVLLHRIQQVNWHVPPHSHPNAGCHLAAYLSSGSSSASSGPLLLQLLNPRLALIQKLSNLWRLLCMLRAPCFQLGLGCIPLLVCALQLLLQAVQLCLLLLYLSTQLLYAALISSQGSSMCFCSLLLLQLSMGHGILNQHLSHSQENPNA